MSLLLDLFIASPIALSFLFGAATIQHAVTHTNWPEWKDGAE